MDARQAALRAEDLLCRLGIKSSFTEPIDRAAANTIFREVSHYLAQAGLPQMVQADAGSS